MEQATYLVTGASSEIACALLKRLSAKGEPARIAVHYRSWNDSLEALKNNPGALEFFCHQADLATKEGTESLIAFMERHELVPTHIVHFAAGKFTFMRMRQLDIDSIERDMRIQVYSLAQILKAFLPRMAKQHFGRVVAMVSSCTIGLPPKCLANYVMVKYALLGLLRSAAAEYGAFGITVNGVSPGMVETKFLDSIDSKIIELDAAANSLKRHITINEVVPALEFLLSEKSGFVNGQNLNLDGSNQL